jgi:hypothetical protein
MFVTVDIGMVMQLHCHINAVAGFARLFPFSRE